MGSFRELEVWQLGRELVVDVYSATATYPADEKFDLTSQSRRAAISIPVNIAEGAGRQTDGSFAQFLRIAIGSANELETLLVLAEDLGLLEASQGSTLVKKVTTIRVKLHNLLAKIKPQAVREEPLSYAIHD
jgi:four helix bundle protein